MTLEIGMDAHGRPCRPHIVAGGFPHRGEAILQRERNNYPLMVIDLQMGGQIGTFGPERYERAAESLTMEMLEDAFSSREATIVPSAAFLAGRCQPDAQEDRERLDALVRDVVDSLPVENLDIMAQSYIQAAMSVALRGDPDAARQALIPLVSEYAATMSESHLAAFYLAQLGDPVGWPAMLECLGNKSNEHVRLMATRSLIAFVPYDGQTVGGKVVDVRGELVQRLKDKKSYVRAEVPDLLAEAGVEGLEKLLRSTAKRGKKKDVRRAARDVLERLKGE